MIMVLQIPPAALATDEVLSRQGSEAASKPGVSEVSEIQAKVSQLESRNEHVSDISGGEEKSAGPHATIERQGNTVTIMLRESVNLKAIASTEESAKRLSAGTDVDTIVPVVEERSSKEETVHTDSAVGEADGEHMTPMVPAQKSPEPVMVESPEVATHARAEEIIHVVVKGDTLWDIARRYMHDPYRFPELARLNKIKNPDLIYPGDRVRILIIRY